MPPFQKHGRERSASPSESRLEVNHVKLTARQGKVTLAVFLSYKAIHLTGRRLKLAGLLLLPRREHCLFRCAEPSPRLSVLSEGVLPRWKLPVKRIQSARAALLSSLSSAAPFLFRTVMVRFSPLSPFPSSHCPRPRENSCARQLRRFCFQSSSRMV